MPHIHQSFKILILASVVVSICGCSSWQRRFNEVLPEYGHRNWIVVADSAYPKQSAPGIETIATDQPQFEVLEIVLDAIEHSPHVQAIVMLDAELDRVSEADAPGVTAYRNELKQHLRGKQVNTMPHEDIIAELDNDAEVFNILILKTNLAIPYTSVFLQLDCGYWNAEKENRLRDALSIGP